MQSNVIAGEIYLVLNEFSKSSVKSMLPLMVWSSFWFSLLVGMPQLTGQQIFWSPRTSPEPKKTLGKQIHLTTNNLRCCETCDFIFGTMRSLAWFLAIPSWIIFGCVNWYGPPKNPGSFKVTITKCLQLNDLFWNGKVHHRSPVNG